MTTLRKPTLIAAGLLLALAAALAVAQTAPAKPTAKPASTTLSGKTTGSGKLMTRDELRSCLKRLDDINQSGKDVDALRPQLDREREALKAEGEALKAEYVEVERQMAAVQEWQTKVRAQSAEIEAFNKRSAALDDAPRNQRAKLVEELTRDRERLEATREALAAEETKVLPVYQSSAKTYNERASARDAKVVDWNKRTTAANEASLKQQEALATWRNECANRPYLEDDEKAIKAGK